MSDNPFSSLVNAMREDNRKQTSASYRIGTVITINPLTVDVAGTVQEKEELLKNSDLKNLEIGDKLFLVPIEDEQRYVILCRVVNV